MIPWHGYMVTVGNKTFLYVQVCQIKYCTHTHKTCDPKPVGYPVPMTNPTDGMMYIVFCRTGLHIHRVWGTGVKQNNDMSLDAPLG